MQNLKTNNNKTIGFQSIFDELFNSDLLNTPKTKIGNSSPAVNIKENENGFFLDFALPGVDKEEVIIELENDLLTVSTEKKEVETKEEVNYTRREFHFNSFNRSFKLPKSADRDQVKADHKNGILTIEIPKREEAKPKPTRKIAIGK